VNLGSVYAVELLLLIHRVREKGWQAFELVRDLRSNGTAVVEALNRLIEADFVSEDPRGRYVFDPISSEHEIFVAEIEKIYASKPISVAKAIMVASKTNCQSHQMPIGKICAGDADKVRPSALASINALN